MKKYVVILLSIICLTGCGKKKVDPLLGIWETNYELGSFGIITEKYEFKENGLCTKTLDMGSTIVENCTYEFNEDKTQIKMVWDSKQNKNEYINFSLNDNILIIGTREYQKKD